MCGTFTLPPRFFTKNLFYHGVARGPSGLTLYAAFHCGLAVLQGLHGLELPGRRGEDGESGKGHEGEETRVPALHSMCGTHRVSSQAPTPAHSHQPSAASSPPDVVDRGAEVMGPVGKRAVQAVFGAVAF